MPESPLTLLVADDEPLALSFLKTLLRNENYHIVTAEDGEKAWRLLEASPSDFDAVILDRMMPGMTGMQVLTMMKAHDLLKMVPVIFQTSMNEDEDILEGFQAGADYYLTKPYRQEILLSVVKTAAYGYTNYKSMQKSLEKTTDTLMLMKTGLFEFRNMDEAQRLSSLLAGVCPDPSRAVLGLWELMINAVEHGNLGIDYDEKSRLIERDEWSIEVEKRMAMPENALKKAAVEFENSADEVRFLIRDQGTGFDWHSFMELKPERAFDPHGRGIHLARTISFDQVEYLGTGSEVLAVIRRESSVT
ncbi:response regulator [Desulfococcaceae bacterium HSG8]|nr:response regulator [Desulfococcaceae bacterium HSG8]